MYGIFYSPNITENLPVIWLSTLPNFWSFDLNVLEKYHHHYNLL